MKKKMAGLAILVVSLLLVMSTLTLNIQPVEGEPDNYLVTVQYKDGTPRLGAAVFVKTPQTFLGITNDTGQISGTLPDGGYTIWAKYPPGGPQFGTDVFLGIPEYSNATITADYEITAPTIEILSPQNRTYTTSSVPLTFTVNDYSPISWMGYSLDNQPNATITGNTTLSGLALGTHDITVYANDTYGNMGSSNKVYFTRTYGCVTIRVQYADDYPRSNARVLWRNTTEWEWFGITNENGVATLNDTLAPGPYEASAWYPDLGTQFGEDTFFRVDANGDGSQTITVDYEITLPDVRVLSPENVTYINTSLPLNFTIYDFSSISWIGHSLDNEANITISGNTTLTDLALGSHSVIVYANDTFGNMGSSDKVYFTIADDIAVTSVVPSKTIVGQGYSISINVTVENQGAFTATLNVTAHANTTTIQTKETTLTSGNSTTLIFTWNTMGVAKGNYTITAEATQLPYETDTTDNTLTDGWIFVSIPGDIDSDKTVNILDCIRLANHFGHVNGNGHTPYTKEWKNCMNCDINSDGRVNILDCIILAGYFGQKWQ